MQYTRSKKMKIYTFYSIDCLMTSRDNAVNSFHGSTSISWQSIFIHNVKLKQKELKSPATASTSVAQYHDGSGGGPRLATRPALAEIGTLCLLTNSVEFQLSKLLLDLDILISSRNRFSHPFGLGQRLILRPDFHGVWIAGLEIDEIGEARWLGGQSGAESGEGLRELRGLSRGLSGWREGSRASSECVS